MQMEFIPETRANGNGGSPANGAAVPAAARKIRGTFLAKATLPTRAKAALANEVAAGRAELTGLTDNQLGAVFQVAPSAIKAARKRTATAPNKLIAEWDRASPQQRAEFIRFMEFGGPVVIRPALSAAAQ